MLGDVTGEKLFLYLSLIFIFFFLCISRVFSCGTVEFGKEVTGVDTPTKLQLSSKELINTMHLIFITICSRSLVQFLIYSRSKM